MMNCWLVSFSSSRQTMRESVSVGPPAGKTTMYFTGLFGQSSAARATPDAIIGAANAPPDRMSARRRGRITFFIGTKPPLNLFLARGVYRSGVRVQQRNAGKNEA